jgi:hypothetical protein
MASKRKSSGKKKKGKPMIGIALRARGAVTTSTPHNPREPDKRRRMPFTQEMADLVCERIAVDGHSLKEIGRDLSMPSTGTILHWAATIPSFTDQYTRARERLLEHWAEDTIDIADTTHEGVKTEISDKFGIKEIHGDMVEHRKLRIEARKWLLSKLAPRKYGEKLDLNLGGQDGGSPIQYEDVRASNLAAIEQLSTRLPSTASSASATPAKGANDEELDAGTD